jgi:predicted transcriptional regulator
MKFNLSNLKTIDWHRVIFISLFVAIAIAVTIACVDQYQDKKAAALQSQAETRAQQAALNKVVTQKEIDHQASVNRLVSICMEAQQSYDKLTAKEKTAKVRPDCTVTE